MDAIPSLAPWRSLLARSLHLHRRQPQSRYLQLATVDGDNRPTNRTVVFRGFCEGTNDLRFVTHARSQKVSHLTRNPHAEVCWYFPRTREQFRLAGTLVAIAADCDDPRWQRLRRMAWHDLSEAARSQFAWPTPGLPRTHAEEALAPRNANLDEPLETFCLVCLQPQRVDYLDLRGQPHDRWHFALRDGTWQVTALTP